MACYINKKLQLDCHELKDLTLTTCDIELLTLRCVHSYGKVFHVMSLYRPPDGSVDLFFEILSTFLDDHQLMQKDLWIIGDFNIDFLKRTDTKTKKLIEFLRINNLKQVINGSTRLTGFSRSCIDLIATNIQESLIVSSGTLIDIISDHMPTYVCIKKKRNIRKFQKIKGRTYIHYEKEVLQTLIRNANWNLFFHMKNPVELWNFIKKTIEDHINVMCSLKYMRIRTDSPPWITQEVIEAMNDRNILYRQFRQSNDPNDYKTARHARNRVNCLLQNSKADYIKQTLDTLKDDPKKFWRVLNDNLLKGNRCSSDITFNRGNEEYTSIPESCEFLNDYFAGIGEKLHTQFNNDLIHRNYTNIYDIESSDEEIEFALDDIVKIIKDIDVHKSSGIDLLPSFIL